MPKKSKAKFSCKKAIEELDNLKALLEQTNNAPYDWSDVYQEIHDLLQKSLQRVF